MLGSWEQTLDGGYVTKQPLHCGASSTLGKMMPLSTTVALSCMRIHGLLGRTHRYDGHILGSMVDAVYYARISKVP